MGHSALSRLQRFPVDRLKIDRSFITPLRNSGAEKGSIPAAMIAMARSLDLQVVAEGVETTEHLAALRRLGCDTAQGYLFSRPISVEEIEPLMGRALCLPDAAGHGAPSDQDRLVHSLLAELQRLSGLDSTFLGDIDTEAGVERIVAARNTGALEIPEGTTVTWTDTAVDAPSTRRGTRAEWVRVTTGRRLRRATARQPSSRPPDRVRAGPQRCARAPVRRAGTPRAR